MPTPSMNSLLLLPHLTAALCSYPQSSQFPNAIKSTNSSHCLDLAFPSRSPTPTRLFPARKDSPWKKCVGRDSPSPDEEEGDDRALRAVLKLYDAIKSKNIHELSEIFGDECRCGCNFAPLRKSFKGKKQVLSFFSYLMRSLGSNIEVVIQPTSQDGMTVGVSWRLEWSKSSVPLGKGFSFHICQMYQGKVLIRNVEMIMEPLLHVQPLVQKLMASMVRIIEKTRSFEFSEGKTSRRASVYILIAALLLVFLMFFP